MKPELITQKVLDIIKKYEGFSEKAYLCPAGVLTYGYGSTTYKGLKIKEGETITKEKAEENLKWYLQHEVRMPRGYFSENQIAALCSLIYNIGQSAFDKSKCKKAIEEKDWLKAKENWDWYTASGKILPGLVRRRAEERKLFFEELGV